MQRNTIWTFAAAATVAGALATLPAVPTALGGPLTPTSDSQYRCYPASAAKGATGDLPVTVIGEDAFGFYNVTLTRAKLFCQPAGLPGTNNTVFLPTVVCFASKDVVRSDFPSGGIKINVTVEHVGDLGLKVKKPKLTCLPVTSSTKQP